MAAAMNIDTAPAPLRQCDQRAGRSGRSVGPARPRLVAVPASAPTPRPAPRVSAATFRRRRIGVLLGVVAVVVMAGRAGAALGGDSLAAPGHAPAVTRYVVQSGDTLWGAAAHLAPDEDPRAVVDALVRARGDGTLMPGEVLRWQH